VTVVQSGQQALSVYEEGRRFDVIVLDMNMPVMDGFELVRQIRNMPQYEMVPIMAVTAFAGTDHAELREKLLTLGADDFIAKPLAEWFLPVVARYLGIA